ncbi:MAG: hypothetical protein KC414_06860, partial [Romboutsia sp.]|nr:hypothetical protein [Romboutsia sp.]
SSEVKTVTSTLNDQVADYYSSLIDLQLRSILNSKMYLINKISFYDQRENENFITQNIFQEDIYSNEHYFTNNTNSHVYNLELGIKTFEFESELNYQLSPFYDIKSGLRYKNIFYDQNNIMDRIVDNIAYTPEFPDTFRTSFISDLAHITNINKAESYKTSAYIENILQINDNLMLNIAGRTDYFDMNQELTFSPRLNLSYSTKFGTILRAAWGHYYQSPIYTQLKYSEASDKNTKSQMAIHYILGVEQDFDLSKSDISTLKFKLDFFYKDYRNLISSYYSHYDKLFYSRINDAVGFARGFDTYLLLTIPKFYTWISYSYLTSMEDELNDNRDPYPRLTAQTHTLAWIGDLSLGKGWGLNTKYYYGSGYPYSEKTLYYYKESNEYIWETEANITSYLPSYQRFDIRIS